MPVAISIHALRKESDSRPVVSVSTQVISIHALRKESDRYRAKGRPLEDLQKAISIHALRKESDGARPIRVMRGEISIHALRKESDGKTFAAKRYGIKISIHALRKESDIAGGHVAILPIDFNPRSP